MTTLEIITNIKSGDSIILAPDWQKKYYYCLFFLKKMLYIYVLFKILNYVLFKYKYI